MTLTCMCFLNQMFHSFGSCAVYSAASTTMDSPKWFWRDGDGVGAALAFRCSPQRPIQHCTGPLVPQQPLVPCIYP